MSNNETCVIPVVGQKFVVELTIMVLPDVEIAVRQIEELSSSCEICVDSKLRHPNGNIEDCKVVVTGGLRDKIVQVRTVKGTYVLDAWNTRIMDFRAGGTRIKFTCPECGETCDLYDLRDTYIQGTVGGICYPSWWGPLHIADSVTWTDTDRLGEPSDGAYQCSSCSEMFHMSMQELIDSGAVEVIPSGSVIDADKPAPENTEGVTLPLNEVE